MFPSNFIQIKGVVVIGNSGWMICRGDLCGGAQMTETKTCYLDMISAVTGYKVVCMMLINRRGAPGKHSLQTESKSRPASLKGLNASKVRSYSHSFGWD